MNIAIIGAGFTGLSAAYSLVKKGHTVTLFEKDTEPGGLAVGYLEKEWEWSLEKHYHHWFTNDKAILSLAKELDYPVLIKRPKTSMYVNHGFYQLDSLSSLLRFPSLSLLDKCRMGLVLGLLKFNPYWKPLEKIKARPILQKLMGKKAFSLIWEPQLTNKMGAFADEISLVWFWTRIYKRTPSLAYPQGGFLFFARHILSVLKQKGVTTLFDTEISTIAQEKDCTVTYRKDKKKHTLSFDKIIVTLPSFQFVKLTPQLPASYISSLQKLRGLGAINLVLRLKKPFFTDNTYWLSICEKNAPIMAIIEHTNFMDKKHYHNEHLVYVGNYMLPTHPYFGMTKKEILASYDTFLKRINPSYQDNLIDCEVFKAPFAQPIVPTNYSRLIPPLKTPLPGVFLANMEQVYPWDRGTNYAVALGQDVSEYLLAHS